MSFTDVFIRRPVLAVVISALLLVAGLQSFNRLELRQFPEVEKSLIIVQTAYPGASADTVQAYVTDALQRRIAGARGIDYLTASSAPGMSTIQVHVRLNEDTSMVQNEVIAKISEAKYELPREIEDPVVTTSQGDDAMMYIAFTSEQLNTKQITDYLHRAIQPELATIEGVGQAQVLSGTVFAMRIWLQPEKLAAYNITAAEVNRALQRNNVRAAPGGVESAWTRTAVDVETDIEDPELFGEIIVRQNGDQRVRLKDIARVELGSERYNVTVYSEGNTGVFVSITSAPGANPLAVAQRVKQKLADLAAEMPADLVADADSDASIYIEKAIEEVGMTLIEATFIVIGVILLFLGSWRVVIIPLVAIPLSLIGVLFGLWVVDFSVNLLTLLAMVIAIGLVVDDAIVVVENIHRHIEEGKTPYEAALIGAREVALPVVAMTLTLAAVYAPIAFVGGLTGTLFSEFALTLAGAVVVSGLIALTLSPMMCSKILRPLKEQGKAADWVDSQFHRLDRIYRRGVDACLANRGAVWLFAGVIFLSLPMSFLLAQRELAPEEDNASIFVFASPPDYANIDYVNAYTQQMIDLWRTIPEIRTAWQVNQQDQIFGGLELKLWDERERHQSEIIAEAQQKYSTVAGLEIYTFAWAALPGVDSGLPVNFVVASTDDYAQLEQVAEELLAKARESGKFIFVNKSLRHSRPELKVHIDREQAAALGVEMPEIADTLQTLLGDGEVSRFAIEGRTYRVIPQAADDFRLSGSNLSQYYVRSLSGQMIPLSSVISVSTIVQPNVRSQYQQLNSITIQGMMMPPNTLGDGLQFLEQELKNIAPKGYRAGYEGESRRYVQEGNSFLFLFGASLILIYLVLSAQFNSFRDPLVVLVSVPLSLFGTLLPLALGWETLNIYTQVGLLTLVGLIAKHGILIVDFANRLEQEGKDRFEAVAEAATMRLRPILMTTFATVLGVLPLLLANGAGAASRFAMGLMIAAGMCVGTLFTLFVLPTFYPRLGRAQSSQ